MSAQAGASVQAIGDTPMADAAEAASAKRASADGQAEARPHKRRCAEDVSHMLHWDYIHQVLSTTDA